MGDEPTFSAITRLRPYDHLGAAQITTCKDKHKSWNPKQKKVD